MKILAMYLPQYHEIPENNEWWGKGYTEWTAVKNAKPYFMQHAQPRIPLNNNYYDLSDETGKTLKWQANIAKRYGVYGFCIYHYWFSTGNQLLERPMEILLKHPEIEINYSICWANETWKRTWWYGSNKGSNEILKEQIYGDKKEWENHFYYLLPFFKDKRYIKIDNKPMVNVYRSYDIDCFRKMSIYWNELAKKNGFDGIYFISGIASGKIDTRTNAFSAYYCFEPGCTFFHELPYTYKFIYGLKKTFYKIKRKISNSEKIIRFTPAEWIYKYNTKKITCNGVKCFLGSFTEWDNSPRKKSEAHIYFSTPKQFGNNLREIERVLKNKGREDDFVYVNAWNEWGEGAYLEPDDYYKYAYLEQIKKIIKPDGD